MNIGDTVAPKSDQLNADDLISGARTVRITRVVGTGNSDQPVAVGFEGDEGRPFKPCKSMRRVMIAAWGPDASLYEGRSMTLVRDPKVKFGGMEVGGIRISHMSHIERDLVMALTVTKAKREPYTVRVLKVAQPAPVAVKAPVVDAPEFIWRTMDGKEVPLPVGTWAKALGKALASMQDAETIREWRSERGGLFASIHESGDVGAALISDAERAIDMRIAELEVAA